MPMIFKVHNCGEKKHGFAGGVERVNGIEPSQPAWKAGRYFNFIGNLSLTIINVIFYPCFMPLSMLKVRKMMKESEP